METAGKEFVARLQSISERFGDRFLQILTRLGLQSTLNRQELALLYRAALNASACNIAINDLLAPRFQTESEATRRTLEWTFVAARDSFFATDGWQALSELQKASVQKIFLNVFVK
jgi:hypothetical protein